MQSLMTWEGAILWLLVAGVGSFGGAWFGAYFRKKGENYATREDVGELTKITKEIEARITDEVWNRQRLWEFKRDVLLEVAKRLGAYREAFSAVAIAFMTEGESPGLEQNRIDRLRVWNEASTEYTTSTRMLVDLVCGGETRAAFVRFGNVTRDGARDATSGKRESMEGWARESTRKYRAACNALRRELGIDVSVESQAPADPSAASPD